MSKTSYNTIKEISEKLLSSLASAGVVLTEAQKSDVDSFMTAIESRLDEQKRLAIAATKSVVERRMDDEYKKVFESIVKHQEVYNRLLEKIAIAQATKKVTEEMAESVDKFIGEKLEACIPDEAIVDYHRLQNLEKTVAVLKETLLIGDKEVQDAIEESKKRISESFAKKEAVLRKNLDAARKKAVKAVNESQKMKKTVEENAAKQLLESKVADLPAYEAAEIKKRLSGKSAAEIEEKFNAVYESVAGQAVEDAKLSLESEINEILNDGEKKDKKICGKKPVSERSEGDERDGDGEGDESQKKEPVDESIESIDGGMMLEWMNASQNINTRLF